jgi:predicted PurR-regulated permease PerM
MAASQQNSSRATGLIGAALVVAVLYFARDVCIPLALAFLLSFLLAPLVLRLRHWGFGRTFSVIVAVSAAVGLVALLTWLMAAQVYDLASKLPQYQTNMQKKVQSFSLPGGGILGKSKRVLRELGKDLGTSNAPEPGQPAPLLKPENKPIPVEVHQPEPTAVYVLRNLLASLATPLMMAGIVIVFMVFMLINRENLRDRLIRLIGAGQLNLTTQALDDAAQRVSRFLLMQLIVNVSYGVPIGIGLYFVGVPNPLLWGLMASVLRFIPYLGPWLAAAMPAALAFAVDPGWGKLLATLGIFVGVELLTYNVLEPYLYSSRTGISAIAVLAGAVFWTWLWGPVGLLLATPLTVCLVVLGRYVPQLEFLSVMMGDEPVLTPEARFYQRLLAMNYEEASDVADEFLAEHSTRALYGQVVIPALALAKQDRQRGVLDNAKEKSIYESARELIQELPERQNESEEGQDAQRPIAANQRASILCLPAADEADELAGLMLCQLLEQRGVLAKTLPASLASERVEVVGQEKVNVVCISALPPGAVSAAKYLCKRLRAQLPEVKIVLGVWQTNPDRTRIQKRIGPAAPDVIVTNLSEAVEYLAPLASQANELPKPEQVEKGEGESLTHSHAQHA